MRLRSLLLILPGLAMAGEHDYFECSGPDGSVVHSITPCGKGHAARRVADASPPAALSLPAGGGGVVRLEKDRSGGFHVQARINGVPVRAMVDTGASFVAIGPQTAARVGVDPRRGRRGLAATANGVVQNSVLAFDNVELGGHRIQGVTGAVLPQELTGCEALLGMSFLRHFEIIMDGPVMVLRPKN